VLLHGGGCCGPIETDTESRPHRLRVHERHGTHPIKESRARHTFDEVTYKENGDPSESRQRDWTQRGAYQ
jgi:hypothetical protein